MGSAKTASGHSPEPWALPHCTQSHLVMPQGPVPHQPPTTTPGLLPRLFHGHSPGPFLRPGAPGGPLSSSRVPLPSRFPEEASPSPRTARRHRHVPGPSRRRPAAPSPLPRPPEPPQPPPPGPARPRRSGPALAEVLTGPSAHRRGEPSRAGQSRAEPSGASRCGPAARRGAERRSGGSQRALPPALPRRPVSMCGAAPPSTARLGHSAARPRRTRARGGRRRRRRGRGQWGRRALPAAAGESRAPGQEWERVLLGQQTPTILL